MTLRPEGNVAHHDESPVSLLTTSSHAAVRRLAGSRVNHRRFRANIVIVIVIVIDTGIGPEFLENGWAGAELIVGKEVVLQLGPGMPAASWSTRPRPESSPSRRR